MPSTPLLQSREQSFMTETRNDLAAQQLLRSQHALSGWLSRVLRSSFNRDHDLISQLESGSILCELLNTFEAGAVRNFVPNTGQRYYWIQNIQSFLTTAVKMGLAQEEIFRPTDLSERKNIPRVIFSLEALAQLAAKRFNGIPALEKVDSANFTTEEVRVASTFLDTADQTKEEEMNLQARRSDTPQSATRQPSFSSPAYMGEAPASGWASPRTTPTRTAQSPANSWASSSTNKTPVATPPPWANGSSSKTPVATPPPYSNGFATSAPAESSNSDLASIYSTGFNVHAEADHTATPPASQPASRDSSNVGSSQTTWTNVPTRPITPSVRVGSGRNIGRYTASEESTSHSAPPKSQQQDLSSPWASTPTSSNNRSFTNSPYGTPTNGRTPSSNGFEGASSSWSSSNGRSSSELTAATLKSSGSASWSSPQSCTACGGSKSAAPGTPGACKCGGSSSQHSCSACGGNKHAAPGTAGACACSSSSGQCNGCGGNKNATPGTSGACKCNTSAVQKCNACGGNKNAKSGTPGACGCGVSSGSSTTSSATYSNPYSLYPEREQTSSTQKCNACGGNKNAKSGTPGACGCGSSSGSSTTKSNPYSLYPEREQTSSTHKCNACGGNKNAKSGTPGACRCAAPKSAVNPYALHPENDGPTGLPIASSSSSSSLVPAANQRCISCGGKKHAPPGTAGACGCGPSSCIACGGSKHAAPGSPGACGCSSSASSASSSSSKCHSCGGNKSIQSGRPGSCSCSGKCAQCGGHKAHCKCGQSVPDVRGYKATQELAAMQAVSAPVRVGALRKYLDGLSNSARMAHMAGLILALYTILPRLSRSVGSGTVGFLVFLVLLTLPPRLG